MDKRTEFFLLSDLFFGLQLLESGLWIRPQTTVVTRCTCLASSTVTLFLCYYHIRRLLYTLRDPCFEIIFPHRFAAGGTCPNISFKNASEFGGRPKKSYSIV